MFPRCTFLVLLVLITGCSDNTPKRLLSEDGRAMGHVVGYITLDGTPLAGAQVDFHTTGTKRSQSGTDENGFYELRFNRRIKGAPVGEHLVKIGLYGTIALDPAAEPLPAVYNAESILKTRVREGENIISFHLTTPEGTGQLTEIGKVAGIVLLDGNPLTDARVEFATAGNKVSEATTDEKGRYRMSFSEKRDGVPLGDNRIRVTKPDKNGKELIRPAFNSKSILQRAVLEGENQFDFSLTSRPPSGDGS